MDEDRVKWDQRYDCEEFLLGRNPSDFLRTNIGLLEFLCHGRRALDIACGEGRNSIFLAQHGFSVTAVDISARGIAKAKAWMAEAGVQIDFLVTDLDNYHIEERFDLIINFNFLLRDLIPGMMDSLNPGGLLLFDTILDSPKLPGEHNKLYLLQPGELHALFRRYAGEILCYEERPADVSPTAKLIFQKQNM